MTNKEAIAVIKTLCHTCESFPKCVNDKPECFKALEMAIDALRNFPTQMSGTSEDTISRQAAIEETWKEPSYTDPINVLTEVRDRIKALPSAQPKINNQINLCDSCSHTYPDCPAGEEDVLYGNGGGNNNICACGKYEVEKRNTGHWVDAGSGMSMWPCKCSVCGGRQGATSKYCPDCGAKMKNNQFNFCDSCKHSEKWWYEPPCDGCCRGHSAYEPIEGK